MALQGNLDTFSLADVLRLLASTTKSGRLHIAGPNDGGSLWFVDGGLVGGETSGRAPSSAANALFELQRLEVERFEFFPDEELAEADERRDVESVISEAAVRLEEWLELAAVVPSLDAAVTLVPELSEDVVEIDRARWRLLATVGGGTSVRRIGDRLELDEFELCRSVKDLVEANLVLLGEDLPDAPHAGGDVLGSRDVTLDVHGTDHRYLPSGAAASGAELLPEPLPGEVPAESGVDAAASLDPGPAFAADVSFEPMAAEPGTDPFGNPLLGSAGSPSLGEESRNGRGGFQ